MVKEGERRGIMITPTSPYMVFCVNSCIFRGSFTFPVFFGQGIKMEKNWDKVKVLKARLEKSLQVGRRKAHLSALSFFSPLCPISERI